ncbi:MAG: CocE/NonD family hydrolase, partial [bacterium]|nr:CocE/NonD family hydrolase [bacterium]
MSPAEYEPEYEPEYEIVHEKNVAVPMRDGTILRANVTRPVGDGAYPALVERTPYNKEGGSEVAVGSPEFFARRGFAVVIQDVRGRFASEGDFYPFRDDGAGVLRDGYDTVEWMAAQPWCDGNVGMYGGSYSGATQYRAALSRPPHLKALFVRESSADFYREWVYRDGAHEFGFSLYWARVVTGTNLPHLVAASDLARQQALFATIQADMPQWYERLPLYPVPFLEGLSDWHNTWLEHPEDGPYWWNLGIDRQHDQIDVPIYHQGGWYDIFLAGTLKNYMGLRRRARSETSRRAQKLIIGPWVHGSGN